MKSNNLKYFLEKIITYIFISLLFLCLPLLSNKQRIYSAYSCKLSVTSTHPKVEKVSGSENTFYYSDEIDINAKKTFAFKFDTSKVPWNSLLTNYQTSQLAFNIEYSPWLNKRTDGITKAADLSWVQHTGTDNITVKDGYKHGKYKVQLVGNGNDEVICEGYYEIIPKLSCSIDSITSDSPKSDLDSNWTVTVSQIVIQSSELSKYSIYFQTPAKRIPPKCEWHETECKDVTSIEGKSSISYPLGKFTPGDHDLSVYTTPYTVLYDAIDTQVCGPKSFHVYERGQPTFTPAPPTPIPGPGTPILSSTPIPLLPSLAPICEQIDSQFFTACDQCVNVEHGIWTAIGCLPTDLELILKNYVFVYGTGITGGIAFLYFIYGVFLILTSGGNPEKIAEGKEIIISALSGLFLIIFSVFLLRVIGYDILKIPDFG